MISGRFQIPVDFKQYEKPWGKEMYSNHGDPHQTIASSGSAPTLCADIVATLIDESVTPSTLAKQAIEWDCRTYMSGTSWPFFQKVAEHYGFPKFVQTRSYDTLIECLSSGGYAVCAMKKGYWCGFPNYILAWAYDDQFIYCHCADSRNKKRQPINDFKAEAKMYFCFYPERTYGGDTVGLKPCKTGNYKHGYSVTHPRLFGVWESMRSRCNNPNRDKYKDYGARGIHVCDEWQVSAEAFCKWAIENGYRDGLQIDRIDNEKGYFPDNCRWVTPKQNSRNRRNTVTLCVNGVTKSVAEWCETINISPFTVYWWVKSKGEKYAETRLSELA